MSYKVLLGMLLLSGAIIGAMVVQLSQGTQSQAQVVEADSGWYPYQLVTRVDRDGETSLQAFNRETGDMVGFQASAGEQFFVGSRPYPAFQFEIDKRGDIVVFESDSGKVWKAKGKQWSSIVLDGKWTNVRPIFEPDN